jgi:predicted esterase
LQAPFEKGAGYAWWLLAPGERSFTATTYNGFEESAALVAQACEARDYDFVVGHSQGAILVTALLALGRLSTTARVILNGVAWPNPFSDQLTKEDAVRLPEILLLVGARDRINPPDQAERVAQALEERGAPVRVVHHAGGHAVPTDEDTITSIRDWMFPESSS